MKKRSVIIVCVILLIWFLLDMTGLYFGNEYFVSQSYKDDGIFFIIYFVVFILFVFKNQENKYLSHKKRREMMAFIVCQNLSFFQILYRRKGRARNLQNAFNALIIITITMAIKSTTTKTATIKSANFTSAL